MVEVEHLGRSQAQAQWVRLYSTVDPPLIDRSPEIDDQWAAAGVRLLQPGRCPPGLQIFGGPSAPLGVQCTSNPGRRPRAWRACSLGGRRHGPAASSCHRSARQHSQCAVSSLRDGVRRRRAQPEGVLLLLRPIGGRLLLGPLLPLPPPPPPPLVWAIGRYPTGVARMQLRINITLAKRSSRMRPGA
jgi:hypothetical protein